MKLLERFGLALTFFVLAAGLWLMCKVTWAQNETFGDAAPAVLLIHYINAKGLEQGVTEVYDMDNAECKRRAESSLGDKPPDGFTVVLECVPSGQHARQRAPTKPETRL